MKTIDFYLNEGLVVKDKSIISLSKKYLEKARNNLITMQALFELSGNEKAKELLKIPKDYESDEWAVISAYYAMYMASLALIAKIGFRSKNHSATLLILEEYFVKKNNLTKYDLSLIKNAYLKREEIEKVSDARNKREIAQYSITKETTKKISEQIKNDAFSFVNKAQEIIEN
jgi:uncharacterized protein (UPF0332 family)